MDSFKRFDEEHVPDKKCFHSSVKDGTTGGDSEKLDSHISNGDYLTCKKFWNEFNMKNMGDYHDHYLKKRCFVISWCFSKVYWYVLKILQARQLSLFSSPGLSWDAMLKMGWS